MSFAVKGGGAASSGRRDRARMGSIMRTSGTIIGGLESRPAGGARYRRGGVVVPRLASFEEVWPYHVAQHSRPSPRRLHFAGTTTVLADRAAASRAPPRRALAS